MKWHIYCKINCKLPINIENKLNTCLFYLLHTTLHKQINMAHTHYNCQWTNHSPRVSKLHRFMPQTLLLIYISKILRDYIFYTKIHNYFYITKGFNHNIFEKMCNFLQLNKNIIKNNTNIPTIVTDKRNHPCYSLALQIVILVL